MVLFDPRDVKKLMQGKRKVVNCLQPSTFFPGDLAIYLEPLCELLASFFVKTCCTFLKDNMGKRKLFVTYLQLQT